jgi:hypothetical protein
LVDVVLASSRLELPFGQALNFVDVTSTTAKMAVNTMDAIKKKMQAMKLEKENAFDKADQLEQKLTEQKDVFEKVRCHVTD